MLVLADKVLFLDVYYRLSKGAFIENNAFWNFDAGSGRDVLETHKITKFSKKEIKSAPGLHYSTLHYTTMQCKSIVHLNIDRTLRALCLVENPRFIRV